MRASLLTPAFPGRRPTPVFQGAKRDSDSWREAPPSPVSPSEATPVSSPQAKPNDVTLGMHSNMRSIPSVLLRYSAILVGSAAFAGFAQASRHSDDTFQLVPKGANENKFGYFPVPLQVSRGTFERPDGIVKEPIYKSAPKYGVIHLGDGPKSDYIFALDEPAMGDWKIYIDKNQNGDLTSGGDGSWPKKTEQRGRTMYGVLEVELRASYGTKTHETSSAKYTIGIYRFSTIATPFMYRESARVGIVKIDGKPHKAVLVENDGDAVFNKAVTSAEEAKKTRPLWLKVDTNDDGKYASGIIDVRAPFKIGDNTYEVKVSDDGSKVDFRPTKKVALELTPKQRAAPELLKSGIAAPNFTAEKWGGGNLSLADYKGKVVVLDFWATWCGPCQMSMPHVEAVNKLVKGQEVAVLGVCVWDDKDAYTKWMPENQSKYTFQFAFDPAGKATDASIAAKLFKVSGIPTTYVIDKNGNVADAIVGYEAGDKRLEAALKKLGVTVDKP